MTLKKDKYQDQKVVKSEKKGDERIITKDLLLRHWLWQICRYFGEPYYMFSSRHSKPSQK